MTNDVIYAETMQNNSATLHYYCNEFHYSQHSVDSMQWFSVLKIV